MPRPHLDRPSDAELQILNILWREGASSTSDVFHELKKERPTTSQQSVANTLQIMLDKGLISRIPDRRPAKYEPAVTQAGMSDVLLEDLATRQFGGSVKKMLQHGLSRLVQRAVPGQKASKKDLEQISKIIEGMEDR
jgi:predicted transcriptional regulator